MATKKTKNYVVSGELARRLFKGVYENADDTSPAAYRLWAAIKLAFPDLWLAYKAGR